MPLPQHIAGSGLGFVTIVIIIIISRVGIPLKTIDLPRIIGHL